MMGNWSNLSIIEMPSIPPASQDLYIVLLTSVLLVFLIILTIAGNIMVLLTFCMCKELRTITNYFLVSLAIADLLTACLAMPIFLMLRITNNGFDFTGGWIFKHLFTGVDIISGTSSIWNLCLISVDRFLAINMPLRHLVILTPRRAQVVIVVVWGFSLALSSLMYIQWKFKAYPIVMLSFILPLVLIIFSYVKIYKAMRNRTFVQRRRSGMKLKRDFLMAKQMILVIGSFIVCWFGFFAVVIILASGVKNVGLVVLNIVKVLTYLNSCLNPLLFTFISHKFKIAFTQIIHCQKPDLRKAKTLISRRRANLEQYNSIMMTNHTGVTVTAADDTRHSTSPLILKNNKRKDSSFYERETTV